MLNRLIANELIRVAKEVLASDDYEYIYDPEHKHRPVGSKWTKTKGGWSNRKEKDRAFEVIVNDSRKISQKADTAREAVKEVCKQELKNLSREYTSRKPMSVKYKSRGGVLYGFKLYWPANADKPKCSRIRNI